MGPGAAAKLGVTKFANSRGRKVINLMLIIVTIAFVNLDWSMDFRPKDDIS